MRAMDYVNKFGEDMESAAFMCDYEGVIRSYGRMQSRLGLIEDWRKDDAALNKSLQYLRSTVKNLKTHCKCR